MKRAAPAPRPDLGCRPRAARKAAATHELCGSARGPASPLLSLVMVQSPLQRQQLHLSAPSSSWAQHNRVRRRSVPSAGQPRGRLLTTDRQVPLECKPSPRTGPGSRPCPHQGHGHLLEPQKGACPGLTQLSMEPAVQGARQHLDTDPSPAGCPGCPQPAPSARWKALHLDVPRATAYKQGGHRHGSPHGAGTHPTSECPDSGPRSGSLPQ